MSAATTWHLKEQIGCLWFDVPIIVAIVAAPSGRSATQPMTCSILLLASLMMLPNSVGHGEECKRNYETLLFPSGMPTSVGWDGKVREEQFRCYAETALSSDVRAIVSAEVAATGSTDSFHKVGLAVISLSPGLPKVLHSTDITSSIPVYVEGPGIFHKMNAVAETVNGGKNLKILHINIWAVLSGSGDISAASDLFYVYREPLLSSVALEIRNSSMFSKENIVSRSKKSSELFLTNSDAGITLYIATREAQTMGSGKEDGSQSTAMYLLHGDKFEAAPPSAEVPTGAIKLQRVPEISVLMAEPGGQ